MDHPLYLALVIAAFSLLGCVLGFASLEETRVRRRAEKEVAPPHPEKISRAATLSK